MESVELEAVKPPMIGSRGFLSYSYQSCLRGCAHREILLSAILTHPTKPRLDLDPSQGGKQEQHVAQTQGKGEMCYAAVLL